MRGVGHRTIGRGRVAVIGALILLIGFGASAYLADQRSSSLAQDNQRSFQVTAGDVSDALTAKLDANIDLTRTMRAVASLEPNAGEARYVRWYAELRRGLAHGSQSADAVLIVPVAASSLPAFERQALADPFLRRQLHGSYQVIPPGVRPAYCLERAIVGPTEFSAQYPLSFDYCAPKIPGVGASPYLGLIRTVTDRGSFIVMPITAIPGLSIVAIGAAVYRSGAPIATVAERRAAVIGYISTTFDPTSMLRSVVANHHTVSLALYHSNPGGALQLVGRFGQPVRGDFARRSLEGGWVLTVSGKPPVEAAATAQGLVVLAVGVLLTLLLFGFYRVLALSRQRAWGLVGEKTQELEYRVLHDPLTGLPNRHLVLDRAEHVLARARRIDVPVTVLFVDIDGFKLINDRFGHQTGDDVLRQVAQRLAGVLRDSDTVGRLGGDEFVLVLDCTGADAAHPELVAERILAALRKPLELPASRHAPVVISASIGIASALSDSAEDLLQDADIAMYQAKAAGKGGYVLFEDSMQAAIADRLTLELDLADALEADQLYLDYQPVLNLASEQVVGVEALLRWQHPTRGAIEPDGFVPLAEASGMIAPIGRWVLGQVCAQGAAWRARGFAIGVSVNVTARQFERPEFLEEVRAALADSNLEPALLTLEITEATMIRRPANTGRLLAALRELGVGIAVDDFGTGYSSLGYLRQFPIDAVKIDRSFVSGLTGSGDASALAHTLIQLGKTLGIKTLAEGVEEDGQLDRLRAEGCDLAQGFLFAHPLSPAQLERFLEGRLGSPLPTAGA
jgi:diguanylate cyclase (GGDEF)-like protein